MPPTRTLRGGCLCGRNLYIVQPPPDAIEPALLLFDPAPSHRRSLASPLPTYLRVPLSWYHSQTQPFFDDETPALIHRTYEPSSSSSSSSSASATVLSATRRNFCGYCGTPLSFWSEGPHPEAEYIRLALGSLDVEDLEELDEWADLESDLQESSDTDREEEADDAPPTGIPWFDSIVKGSRLGRHLALEQQKQKQKRDKEHVHRHEAGSARSADGSVQVEWEVLEWTEGDADDDTDTGGDAGGDADTARRSQPSPAKRARLGGDGDSDVSQDKSVSMD